MLNTGILQGIVRDIRERKETQRTLNQAREELERRVLERTKELAAANLALQEEIAEKQRAEEARKELLQQLVTIQEDERRRIAREYGRSGLRQGSELRSQDDASGAATVDGASTAARCVR